MVDVERLKQSCLFCRPEDHGQAKQILLRSDNFYLFAGLGPLVEGYIMIVPYRCDLPKHRFFSFADIPRALLDEAIFLRGLISEFYRDTYQQETSMHFEHGRAGTCFPRANDTLHCHHAHLCCYPVSFRIWNDMVGLETVESNGFPVIDQLVGTRDYLFVGCSLLNETKPYDAAERELWRGKVALIDKEKSIESQYLRRLLSARLYHENSQIESDFLRASVQKNLKSGDAWDWAVFPEEGLVEQLIVSFAKWLPETDKYKLTRDQDEVARLDFLKSVEKSNRVGNDNVSVNYHSLWFGNEQYSALGKFLSNITAYKNHRPRVLDIGCGPGHYLRAMYSLGIECVGVDASTKMLQIAKQVVELNKTEAEGRGMIPPPRLEMMDIFNLEFKDETFDAIWFSAVLVHVPRKYFPDLLGQFYQLLNSQGILYISTQVGCGSAVRREGRVFYYYEEMELKHLFEMGKFTVVEQWGDETNIGSKGDTRKKVWIHFILRKREEPVLSDLGERKLLERIESLIPKYDKDYLKLGVGDDCAALKPLKDELIVATTDPCPKPVIVLLGEDDPWYYGWFSMVISLSDLGSMGARPLGMLLAVEAQQDMTVQAFDRFYEGIIEASETFGCPIIGGNVKDATVFNCIGTALGSIHPDHILKRDAAQPGELVVVLGDMGRFWAGVISKLESLPLESQDLSVLFENLKKPIPRIREGQMLANLNLSKCAMDSSDGLIGCFYEIASASSDVDINLDFSNVAPDPLVQRVANLAHIDVRKLMLAWGDWELVCTIEKKNLTALRKTMHDLECPIAVVGNVTEGSGQVWFCENRKRAKLTYLASERFTKQSYFSYGLGQYLSALRSMPLYMEK